MSDSGNVVEMRGIDKAFPGVQALSGVDFFLKRGEIHAIIGENGAGKSTLIKALTGVEKPDAGTITLEGDEIAVGRTTLRVIHIPGHTPGSIGFVAGGVLFSGDTLFCGGVGRTDLPGGSWKDLESSIREKILTLPEETVVLPGHGPWTTVEQEKNSNPFLT